MSAWADRGARAAEDILRRAYGVDVQKGLDPLDPRDFGTLSRALARSLRGHVVPVEGRALQRAMSRLDADWTELGAEAREKLIGEAAKYLGSRVVDEALPAIQQTLDVTAEELVSDTKRSVVQTYHLDIRPALSSLDERVIRYASTSQGHFIRNQYGVREDLFSQRAKDIVADSLRQGLGSSEIASSLHSELAGVVGRGQSYWDMIAMVFANRSRTMAQLGSYHEAGLEWFEWESVLDEATSMQCRFLHGRRFQVAHAMRTFQRVEDERDPEAIKVIQPFLSMGRDGDREALVFGRGDARRVAAHVTENVVGQKDKIGSFAQAMSTEQLSQAGIAAPPIHGRCRSTTKPVFA